MIRWIVGRAPLVGLGVLCVTVLGLITYSTLPRESSPDVEIPFVMVSTPYVGVSPRDIETLVTTPIENELAGMKDLKEMRSTSAEGASIITLEFEPDIVIEDALQRVRDRVNRARADLPDDAEDTDIREVSFSDFPILIVTIAGPLDDERLKAIGEAVEEDVRRIPGVLDAELAGGRTREIRVQVDPRRLNYYGLTLDDVKNAIGDANVNVPGGDVTSGGARFLLRVPGEFTDPAEVEDVAISERGGQPVFVRDVARVVDSFADRSSYARMNGETAVSIAVSKRSGENILEIAEAVKALLADVSAGWPEGVEYRVLADQSRFIEDMVSELENGIITALLLVVAVVMFFMGVRNSFFVAIAIPLSMLLAVMLIGAFGMTLNMIVLFSLILALGMLVDNAIVLVENVYRHVEEGKDLREAAVVGTQEVAGAVAASTATTVAAFLPLLFWTGMMGEFMGYMPKTVVIVLVCSLVVAVGVLPVVSAKLMKRGRATEGPPVRGRVMRVYQRLLELSIDRRYVSAGLGLAVLVGTFAAYGRLGHGTEFFAETEPNRAFITVRAPDGTDLEATDAIVQQVEALLRRTDNVDVFVAETGVSGGGDPMSGAQAVGNVGRITIDFLPDRNTVREGQRVRVEPPSHTVDRLRRALAEIPGAELTIQNEDMGPPTGKPIAVEVSGEDFHAVGDLAARVRRELAAIEGVTDLSDDYRVGRPEMRLRIDRDAARRIGANTNDIAQTVRTAVAGSVASTLRDGEDEYDIVVELAPEYRQDLQIVMSLRLPGYDDSVPGWALPVPLNTVAGYELAGGSGSIRHVDQDLMVTIEGDVVEGMNVNEVQQRVMAYLEEAEVPPGFALRLGGQNDEQEESAAFLMNAFLVAVFLIGLVLVYQFNRFDLPLIILASVVLSLVGVLWGLIVTGTPFGIMMTGLGVISLAGIVVNNAIVLLDYVEQLRARGLPLREALVEAGLTRFRPVVLTAVTTCLGLIPMAIGVSYDFRNLRFIVGSQSAAWWGPMAVAVIFGLAVATVLTLVMVPTLYGIAEDGRRLRERVRAAVRRRRASHAPLADRISDPPSAE